MKARVTVTLKTGILDPQGKAIEGALKSLGVGGVASVRQGKVFDIEVDGTDRSRAEVLVGGGLGQPRHRSLDPYLPAERMPVEDERGPRVLGELAALTARVAGEEREPVVSIPTGPPVR